MKRKNFYKKLIFRVLVPGFLLLNGIAFMHAWRFTHYPEPKEARTADPESLSLAQKAMIVFTGISNPKSVNEVPRDSVERVLIPSRGEEMEGWWIEVDSAKGIVILFPGYAGRKSDLQTEARAFRELGYHTLLVDFPGHGGSTGHQTSVGFHESADVQATVAYVAGQYPDQDIVLYGFSMGAVAILKALGEAELPVRAAIVGAPFGSLLQTVRNRFTLMGLPSFPFADLLVFWGGIQHGYWGFAHRPIRYAETIQTPILIQHGGKDERAELAGVQAIYEAIPGQKHLSIYEDLAHQSYCRAAPMRWKEEIQSFLTISP